MTTAPLYEVYPDSTIGYAMELMIENKIRHTPVVFHLADSFSQEYRPIGILSMKDILNALYKSMVTYV